MAVPPDRRTAPILLMQAAHEWIGRINQKQKQLSGLDRSEEHQQRLARRIEIEFVYSTLKLAGKHIEFDRVARLASGGKATPGDLNDQEVVSLLESLRKVGSLARTHGTAASLTPALLIELHGPPGKERGLRRTAVERAIGKPVPPEHLPQALESACQWYDAQSFGELHPVEQASIVLLRLMEMRPFEQENERTAFVAASLFTLRSGLPPIIIRPEMEVAYRAALEEGLRINTKPMVEFLARSIEKSLEEMILLAKN